jgi:uncharacterized protein YndB with AHSA1/START domain
MENNLMNHTDPIFITVEVTVQANVDTVWEQWTNPIHIVKWNSASDDWHTTRAENDLRVGGKFTSRMEAKDGSFGFDFWGTFDQVVPGELLESTLGDGRKLTVRFKHLGDVTVVTETFEAETENTPELQKTGWQAILNNFKKHVESGGIAE